MHTKVVPSKEMDREVIALWLKLYPKFVEYFGYPDAEKTSASGKGSKLPRNFIGDRRGK